MSGEVVSGSRYTDDGDNIFADAHASSTDEEKLTATEIIDCPHTGDGGNDVDNIGNDRDDERIGDTGLSEESGSVVEDKLPESDGIQSFQIEGTYVDTSELLPSLEEDSSENTGTVVSGTIPEAVDVRSLGDFLFVAQIGFDFSEISLDFCTIDVGTKDSGEIPSGLLCLSLLDQISGRFREECHPASEDSGPDELDGNDDSISRGVSLVLFSLVGASGEQKTDGNGPLIARNDGSTNPFGRTFGLIHGNQAGNDTDSQTSNKTTDYEKGRGGSSNLEGNTDRKDEGAKHQAQSAISQELGF